MIRPRVTRLGKILPFGLLLKTQAIFGGRVGVSSPKSWWHFGVLLPRANILYIFTVISSFKAWFVAAILRVIKWFNVDVLEFQIQPCCRYFDFFGLTTNYFGHFFLNLGEFIPIFWSPWLDLWSLTACAIKLLRL